MLALVLTFVFQLATSLAYRMLALVLTFFFQQSASLAYRMFTLVLTPFLKLSACLAVWMLSAIVTLGERLGANLTGLHSRFCWLRCCSCLLLSCCLILFRRSLRFLSRFRLLFRLGVFALILTLGNHLATCATFLA